MSATAGKQHHYAATVTWTGNRGDGTSSYAAYGREYTVAIDGKPELRGSADPAYRGDPAIHNPEDLFLTAIAGCHMLFYLALCARRGVRVLSYQDEVRGTLSVRSDGGGAFDHVTLAPVVTIAAGGDEALARQLHDRAHELCFIANSCRVPIRHEPTIRIE